MRSDTTRAHLNQIPTGNVNYVERQQVVFTCRIPLFFIAVENCLRCDCTAFLSSFFFATFLHNLHFLQLYHAMGVINNFPFWPRSGVDGGQIALIHLVRHWNWHFRGNLAKTIIGRQQWQKKRQRHA